MTALPKIPTLPQVTPAYEATQSKHISTVLLISATPNVDEFKQAIPGVAVYTLDPLCSVDTDVQTFTDLGHIDLIWVQCNADPTQLFMTAPKTLRRASMLVVEFGTLSFLKGGRAIDAGGHGIMYRIVKLALGYEAVGYDIKGTLVLKNIRPKFGANIVQKQIANTSSIPVSIPSEPPAPQPQVPQPPKSIVDTPSTKTPVSQSQSRPQRKPPRTKPVITMERLGTFGQWGKQVVQYAFVRSYAKQHNISYEVPLWAGRYLFGLNDPDIYDHISPILEETAVGQNAVWGKRIPPQGKEFINRDFIGWAQFDTNYYLPTKDFIQSLFSRPAEPQRSRVMLALDKLYKKGDTLIGLHLRRGDSGRTIYPLTPIGWCLRWLSTNWNRFTNPVLYIATEDPSLKKHFQEYDAVLAEDVGIHHLATPYPGHVPYWTLPGRNRSTDFFPDWFVLQRSDVVLASNSMFSMSAAWTSTDNTETWRPRLSIQDFEQVDPWNMRDFVNREHLDDYPGIPGTQLDDNPGYDWLGFHPTHPSVPEIFND